jgi:DNA ligase (NAD+)
VDAILQASEAELQEVEGVGPKVAAEVHGFLTSEENRAAIQELREHVDVQPADTETADELDGLTVVFTGSVEGWTRDDLEDLVESHGGRATGSVSGNTDYLVVGERPGTSKRSDAAAADVPELSPEEFFDLLADEGVEI